MANFICFLLAFWPTSQETQKTRSEERKYKYFEVHFHCINDNNFGISPQNMFIKKNQFSHNGEHTYIFTIWLTSSGDVNDDKKYRNNIKIDKIYKKKPFHWQNVRETKIWAHNFDQPPHTLTSVIYFRQQQKKKNIEPPMLCQCGEHTAHSTHTPFEYGYRIYRLNIFMTKKLFKITMWPNKAI